MKTIIIIFMLFFSFNLFALLIRTDNATDNKYVLGVVDPVCKKGQIHFGIKNCTLDEDDYDIDVSEIDLGPNNLLRNYEYLDNPNDVYIKSSVSYNVIIGEGNYLEIKAESAPDSYNTDEIEVYIIDEEDADEPNDTISQAVPWSSSLKQNRVFNSFSDNDWYYKDLNAGRVKLTLRLRTGWDAYRFIYAKLYKTSDSNLIKTWQINPQGELLDYYYETYTFDVPNNNTRYYLKMYHRDYHGGSERQIVYDFSVSTEYIPTYSSSSSSSTTTYQQHSSSSSSTTTYQQHSSSSSSTTTYQQHSSSSSSTTTYNQHSSSSSSTTTYSGDDNYEENDTLATAYDLSSYEQTWLNTINGYGKQADEDWFRIYVNSDYLRVVVDCQFTHSEGDIDVGLYDLNGNMLVYPWTETDNEYIDYTVSAGGTYYIKVYYGNAGNQYDLRWDDLPNGSVSSSSSSSSSTTTYQQHSSSSSSTTTYQQHSSSSSSTTTYQQHSSSSSSTTTYQQHSSSSSSTTTYQQYSSSSSSSSTTTYYDDDSYENNNTMQNAYDLIEHEHKWLSSINGFAKQYDEDWYKIELRKKPGRLWVYLVFEEEQAGVDVFLYDDSGNWNQSYGTVGKILCADFDYIIDSWSDYYLCVRSDGNGNKGVKYDLFYLDEHIEIAPDEFDFVQPPIYANIKKRKKGCKAKGRVKYWNNNSYIRATSFLDNGFGLRAFKKGEYDWAVPIYLKKHKRKYSIYKYISSDLKIIIKSRNPKAKWQYTTIKIRDKNNDLSDGYIYFYPLNHKVE